ncbi:50S ribosomal protein L21e [Candidatus Woesearchaeota archaeon]|nr:50S ribosomal protein L21e [Candidatus Woesearchaeota archaeon]
MAQRTGGLRRKTRSKLKKNVRMKGKLSIRNYLQSFSVDDTVALVMEPSYHGGIYHPRFQGDVGIIVGKQGTCYRVQIKDGNMKKIFIVHPVHLKRQQS